MTTPVVEAVRVLRALLPGVPVGTKAPNPRPTRYVRVTRAGGRRSYGIDHMLLIVECWASDEGQAERDVYAVDDLFQRCADVSALFAAWSDATVASFPDPDLPGMYRYQLSGTMHCA